MAPLGRHRAHQHDVHRRMPAAEVVLRKERSRRSARENRSLPPTQSFQPRSEYMQHHPPPKLGPEGKFLNLTPIVTRTGTGLPFRVAGLKRYLAATPNASRSKP